MRKLQRALYALSPAVILIFLFSITTFQGCQKDECKDVHCLNGGVCNKGTCTCPTGYSGTYCQLTNSSGNNGNNGGNNGGGNNNPTTTSLIFQNNTFTPVSITINGVQKEIASGASVTFTGTSGTAYNGTASTSQPFGNGGTIGLTLSWNNLSGAFPSTNATTIPLNIGPEYYFIRLTKNTSKEIKTLIVNYGLADQSSTNVSITANGVAYGVGYYKTYSNSNFRAIYTDNSYIYWNQLTFTGTNNQLVNLTAN